jgi:hypothetical protein
VPKQRRWQLKRECDQLKAALVKAATIADGLMQVYYPNYPQYYLFVQTWLDAIRALVESVSKFREDI